ncbi:N-acetylmuramoyl-L-alanine amidase [Streptomyces adustus]|uniref:N-acetylmuramoyl-L-alanine amidase n=1 Tax=Streptomyces adustus TaxID=1609272 RepID=A0A5N8VCP0_9ACTN|nr:N-acetylmuramoyl-L-alanine amidase [Streptomyces adustus]MPY33030.1 N-acetylmuramoyl-L-alanine amidase [Streptomyces adustus]
MWGAVAVAAAVSAGAVVVVRTADSSGAGADAKAAGPVATHVRSTALHADGAGGVSLSRPDTEPFSMLRLSWDDPSAQVRGAVTARTRLAGSQKWSPWLTLEADDGGGEDTPRKGMRGATGAAWFGPSDGVEIKVAAGGTLPAGLRLDVVDPGVSAPRGMEAAAYAVAGESPDPTDVPADPSTSEPTPAETTEPSVTASESVTESPAAPTTTATATTASPSAGASSTAPTAPTASASATAGPPSTVPQPPVVSRAEWQADESLNTEAPEYGTTIKAVFVHHTAQTNTYSCADSPAIVRGLRAMHLNQGWKDIGYNFVVDKCGTIFEGRKGGIDRPVIGAQAEGFNTNTTGIAVIGTYTDVDAPVAAKAAIARLAAWKLGQYGVDPLSKVTLTAGKANGKFALGQSADFNRISGHRDAYATECPGTVLYNQLPTVRTWAAGPVAGLAVKSLTGAALSGSTYLTKGAVTVNWAATTPASLITKYEVLVDGKSVVSKTGTATSAAVTLAVGSHTVQVRATHQSGKTATTPAVAVTAETTPPVFATKPALSLRTGTVDTAAVPVTLAWKATDTAGLKEVRLTTPAAKTYGPTVTSAALTAKSGAATAFALTAQDLAGNTAVASASVTPVIVQETSAVKTGTWTSKTSTSYLGGGSLSSSTKNASLSWTFTGRSVSWIVSRAATSGQADVYVDGAKAATVDLKSTTTAYRSAIWTKNWSAAGKHTVKIVVTATSGRPTVTTDGIVYLK